MGSQWAPDPGSLATAVVCGPTISHPGSLVASVVRGPNSTNSGQPAATATRCLNNSGVPAVSPARVSNSGSGHLATSVMRCPTLERPAASAVRRSNVLRPRAGSAEPRSIFPTSSKLRRAIAPAVRHAKPSAAHRVCGAEFQLPMAWVLLRQQRMAPNHVHPRTPTPMVLPTLATEKLARSLNFLRTPKASAED